MPIAATGSLAKTITVDSLYITSFSVNTFPSGSESINIFYSAGYYEGEKFIPHDSHHVNISGANFMRLAAADVDTSMGLFGALQTILLEEIERDRLEKEV